ncbi:MAG: AMIN domain-containing protein [Acidobacteria bacterium]|nr:AMIN domain-containing protein [Acidobacteriota bacterium]
MKKTRIRTFFLLPLLCLVLFGPGLAAHAFPGQAESVAGTLLSVSISEKNTVQILSIRCNRAISYHYFEMKDPDRLVIDLKSVTDIQSVRQIDLQRRGLAAIRVGQYKWDTARVVIDFSGPVLPYVIEEGGLELTVYLVFSTPKEVEKPVTTPPQRPDSVTQPRVLKPPEKIEREHPPPPPPQEKVRSQPPETKTKRDAESTSGADLFPDSALLGGENRGRPSLRLELQTSFYFPASKSVKQDYGNGLTGGLGLAFGPLRFLDFWIAARWIRGIPLGGLTGDAAGLNIFPVEAGLKLHMTGAGIVPYVGAGIGLHFIQEVFAHEVISSQQWALIGQAGFLFPMDEHWLFDIHFHYRFKKYDPESDVFPLRGFHIGAGFGWRF